MDLKNILEIVEEINYIIDTTDLCEFAHVYIITDGNVVNVMFRDSSIWTNEDDPDINAPELKRKILDELKELGDSAEAFFKHYKEVDNTPGVISECKRCGGSGLEPASGSESCHACNGKGEI